MKSVKNSENKEKLITSIGGSALIEGIMMKGPKKTTVALRMEDDSIYTEDISFTPLASKSKLFRLPIIRGVFGFIDSMRLSYKALELSADKILDDAEIDQSSKFEKWLDEKLGDKLTGVIMTISMIIGILLAVMLFIFLPSQLFTWLTAAFPSMNLLIYRSVFEGVIKIILFLAYIMLCTLMPDMKRTFQYHGAEHKTIFCYENRLELTVENVKKQSRFHPRCGTSFMILMLFVGIIIGLFIKFENPFLRTGTKILLLPVTVGLGYELIKLCGKHDNVLTRIIAAPGIWAQRITTKEPDEKMIEVAIEAMKSVIPENGEDLIKLK